MSSISNGMHYPDDPHTFFIRIKWDVVDHFMFYLDKMGGGYVQIQVRNLKMDSRGTLTSYQAIYFLQKEVSEIIAVNIHV